jgi:hypothetical protein
MKTAVSHSDFDVQKIALNAKFGESAQKITERKANLALRTHILALRKAGYSISTTATLQSAASVALSASLQ